MKMMYILICHKLSDMAGTTRQAVSIANGLAHLGKEVILCGEGNLGYEVSNYSLLSVPSSLNPLSFKKNVLKLISKYIKSNQSFLEIVHAFDPIYAGSAALAIAKKYNIPSLLRIGAVYEDFYAAKIVRKFQLPILSPFLWITSSLIFKLMIQNMNEYSRVYANCNFLAKHYENKINQDIEIGVIPNITKQGKETENNDFKIQEKGLKLLFVGRIEPRKNLIELIIGVERFVKNGKIQTLTIIGSESKDPKYAKNVRELAKDKLGNKVKFLGFVDSREIHKFYSNHDVTIFTTSSKEFPITEGMPNVLLESISAGTLVIATNVAGVPEFLRKDLSIFLIDSNDVVNELAEKLKWFNNITYKERFEYLNKAQNELSNYYERNVMKIYTNLVNKLSSKITKKKVALFCPYPYNQEVAFGGVVVVSKNLINGFNRIQRGEEIIVISFNAPINHIETRYSHNVKIYFLPQINIKNLISSIFQVRKIVDKENVKLIHAQDTEFYGMLSILMRKKQILTVHGLIQEEVKIKRQYPGFKRQITRILRKYVDLFVLKNSKNIISINSYVKNKISEITNAKFYDIVNPIDDIFFHQSSLNHHNKNVVNFIWVGTLYPRKSLETLIFALHLIRGKISIKNVLINIVGSIKGKSSEIYFESIKKLIEKFDLQRYLEFYSGLSDRKLIELYDKSDALIITAKEENAPLIIIEALVRNCNVIASCVGGIPTMLQNMSNYPITLYNYGDYHSLGKLMVKQIKSSKLKTKSSQIQKYCPLNDFYSETIALKTHKLYNALLN